MSDGREKLVSQFGYSGRIDDQPTSRKADFDRPNNPFSLDPIAPTQGSTQKVRARARMMMTLHPYRFSLLSLSTENCFIP